MRIEEQGSELPSVHWSLYALLSVDICWSLPFSVGPTR